MIVSKPESAIYGTRKRLLIRLPIGGVCGQLKATGKTGGFRFLVEGADSFPISSVSINGNEICIYTTAVYNAVSGLEQCTLSYQPSDRESVCDDSGSTPEPFENMPLAPLGNYSTYFHCGSITAPIILQKEWDEMTLDDVPESESFHPFICNANVINPRILNHLREYPKDSVVYLRFELDCAEDMDAELLWGCSGQLKCRIDCSPILSHSAEVLTFASLKQRVSLSAGRHTITAAFRNMLNGRGDKGVTLRLLRLDSPNGELPMLVRSSDAQLFLNV